MIHQNNQAAYPNQNQDAQQYLYNPYPQFQQQLSINAQNQVVPTQPPAQYANYQPQYPNPQPIYSPPQPPQYHHAANNYQYPEAPQGQQAIGQDYANNFGIVQIPLIPAQPNINQLSELIMNADAKERKKFMILVTILWLLLAGLQLLIGFIVSQDDHLEDQFFNTERLEYTGLFYGMLAISVISGSYAYCRRAKMKNVGVQVLVFLVYSLSYAFFSGSSISAAGVSPSRMTFSSLFAILYFFLMVHLSYVMLGILVILVVRNQIFESQKFMGPLVLWILPVLLFYFYLITRHQNGFPYVSIVMQLIALSLGSFYIWSLLQLIEGKFRLRKQDVFLGSILVYFNMLVPCASS